MRPKSLLYAAILLVSLAPALGAQDPPQRIAGEIVNGTLTWEAPSVGLLDLDSRGVCTGTLVGCRTFVTAAHCVCTEGNVTHPGSVCRQRQDLLDPAGKRVFFQHTGFHAVASVAVHPDFRFGTRSDLAVLRLAEPVTGIEPSRINQARRPSLGSPGRIVGFGRTSGATGDTGLKRAGSVTTAPCQRAPGADNVCWEFAAPIGAPGVDSSTCQGDSGGPLFVDLGAGPVLAGVTSGGRADCAAPNQPFDSDVFVDRAWIESVAGADLHATRCGSLPFAGRPGARVDTGSAMLSSGSAEHRFRFEVAPGTDSLRVTLNGEAPFDKDFDLYLRHGSAPTAGTYDCRGFQGAALEACGVEDPAPGTWHGMARRFRGDGRLQWTATRLSGNAGGGGGGGAGGGGGGGDRSPCLSGELTLCVVGGRFEVTATSPRSLHPGLAGRVSPVFDGELGGAFHFFRAEENFQAVVKVSLRLNGHYAVAAASVGGLPWTIAVRDTLTGQVKRYTSRAGELGVPTDPRAFPANP